MQLSDKCLADTERASPEKPGTEYADLAEQVIPLGEMEINMEADLLRMSGKSNQEDGLLKSLALRVSNSFEGLAL